MKKILRPLLGNILDIDALELADDALSTARNVHMRKAFPSLIGGRRVAYPVSSGHAPNSPLHLLNLSLNTFNWWMLFGTNNVFAVESSNSYDISLAGQQTVANPYEWSSTLLNGIPVFTNGKDLPLFWNGNGGIDVAAIPGWPAATVCKSIVAFKFHLFALNIDGPGGVFENQIKWSSAAAPGALPTSWTAAPSNEAGDAILAQTIGRCVAGLPLGSQLLIYKPTSVYAAEYFGQQPSNIFGVRCISSTIGLLAPHCLKEIRTNSGTFHLVVGNDDVVLTDGVSPRSVADGRIRQYLAGSIDETNALNTFVVRDINKRETWVCAPEAGATFATVAHIWDEARDTWVTRDLNNAPYATIGFVEDSSPSEVWDADGAAWDTDITTWNQNTDAAIPKVVVVEGNTMYLEDAGGMATSLIAELARLDLTFDDSDLIKTTGRVHIEGSGAGLATLEVRLGSRDSTDAAINWTAYSTRLPEGTPLEATGRFISVSIRNTVSTDWTVTRITIEAEPNGYY